MVRTSLDPALQITAERSLRDGLMAYDRKMGGWRGAVTRLNVVPADFETTWPAALNEVAKTAGNAAVLELAVAAAVTNWRQSRYG